MLPESDLDVQQTGLWTSFIPVSGYGDGLRDAEQVPQQGGPGAEPAPAASQRPRTETLHVSRAAVPAVSRNWECAKEKKIMQIAIFPTLLLIRL